jgi:hypothetical protein
MFHAVSMSQKILSDKFTGEFAPRADAKTIAAGLEKITIGK